MRVIPSKAICVMMSAPFTCHHPRRASHAAVSFVTRRYEHEEERSDKNIDLSASDVRGNQRLFTVVLLTPSSCAVRSCFAKRSRSTREVLDPNLAI
jgi:hypothetical protein